LELLVAGGTISDIGIHRVTCCRFSRPFRRRRKLSEAGRSRHCNEQTDRYEPYAHSASWGISISGVYIKRRNHKRHKRYEPFSHLARTVVAGFTPLLPKIRRTRAEARDYMNVTIRFPGRQPGSGKCPKPRRVLRTNWLRPELCRRDRRCGRSG